MGYRSDVRIMLTNKGFNELKKFNDNYLEGHKYNLLEDLDINKIGKYWHYIGWNSIKWYEYGNYKEVDAIMNGLEHLASTGYSYRFARIGEDYDDYEEKSFESDNEEEQDLTYPSLIREFDDDYVINDMKASE